VELPEHVKKKYFELDFEKQKQIRLTLCSKHNVTHPIDARGISRREAHVSDCATPLVLRHDFLII
jgi:hypothetical protein